MGLILGLGVFVRYAMAGQVLPVPFEPDARWILVSPTLSELQVAPIQLRRTKSLHLKSPLEARRARMAAEQMRIQLPLNMSSGDLYYPNPVELPLYVEKTN